MENEVKEVANYYLYTHAKPCGTVFYVGISKHKSRKTSRSGRSSLWFSHAKNGYSVCVIKDGLTLPEAVIMEREYIGKYGKIADGGTLANQSYEAIGTYNSGNKLSDKDKRVSVLISLKQWQIDSLGGYKEAQKKITKAAEKIITINP